MGIKTVFVAGISVYVLVAQPFRAARAAVSRPEGLRYERPQVISQPTSGAAEINETLTSVAGLNVGRFTVAERPTGCTVILVDGDAVGGVSQQGGAPGTRETDLLNPLNMVDKVNAIVLAGGSAFGLEAATGTVRWLEEHNIGRPARGSAGPDAPGARPVRS